MDKILFGFIIFLILCGIGLTYTLIGQNQECVERELGSSWDWKNDCSSGGIVCYDDCEKLGLEYFKYDSGWNSECWCKVNNETRQIW